MVTLLAALLQKEDDELKSTAEIGTIKMEFRFGTTYKEPSGPESMALPGQLRLIKKEAEDEKKSM